MTESNKNMQWCPNKGCSYLIEKSEYAYTNQITCKCKYSFCFDCLREDHVPATCQLA